jgi:hypothetical protein
VVEGKDTGQGEKELVRRKESETENERKILRRGRKFFVVVGGEK